MTSKGHYTFYCHRFSEGWLGRGEVGGGGGRGRGLKYHGSPAYCVYELQTTSIHTSHIGQLRFFTVVILQSGDSFDFLLNNRGSSFRPRFHGTVRSSSSNCFHVSRIKDRTGQERHNTSIVKDETNSAHQKHCLKLVKKIVE